jgi:imidazole glycerol-phosphate synthase subunit HisF
MTLHSRIFPVLLIRDGGLVKTRQFSDDRYVGDPMNAVKIFNEKEVDELVVFDIDALEKIAVESRMPLAYGGGVTSASQAATLISIGYEKVSVSAAALERPQLIEEMAARVGRQSVVVTIDTRKRGFLGGHTVWSHNATRKHKIGPLEFAEHAASLGAGEIIFNAIDRDGMMNGYDLALAAEARRRVDVPLSFVGGAGSLADMEALINEVGVIGAGAGSLFVFKGSLRAVLISYGRPSNAAPSR